MKKYLSIHCIYKAQKTAKKTNRCQKINVQILFDDISFNLTDVSKTIESKSQSKNKTVGNNSYSSPEKRERVKTEGIT